MPNDNLKVYYDYLKSNGADVAPTYDAFANALSDEKNAKKYHSYLINNGFDAPNDYNKFVNRLGLVKKKEVSQSTQNGGPASLVTQETARRQRSESSSQDDGIYVNPWNNENYKKSAGKWYKDVTGAGDFKELKSGDLKERYDYLNKNATKVSDLKGNPIEISYDLADQKKVKDAYNLTAEKLQKEEKKRQAELAKKAPEQKPFTPGIVDGKVFNIADDNQKKEYDKAHFEYVKSGKYEKDVEAVKKEKDLNDILNSVDTELVGSNEDEVISKLQNKLKKYDYLEVESAGFGYDAIKIKNNITGESKFINLDNWTTDRDSEESKLLKGFLEVNIANDEYTRKQKQVNDLRDRIEAEKKSNPYNVVFLQKELDELLPQLDKEREKKLNYMSKDKYRSAAAFDKYEIDRINDNITKTILKKEDIKKQASELGEYEKTVNESFKKGLITEEDYNANYLPKINQRKQEIDNNIKLLRDDYRSISNEQSDIRNIAGNAFVVESERGNILSGTAFSVVQGMEQAVRAAIEGGEFKRGSAKGVLTSQFAPESFSEEYLSSENRNAFEQVVFGLANSAGSALAGAMTGSPVAATMGLFGASYTNFRDQMNGPEFDDVPEYQKMLLAGSVGAVTSLLEKYGLTKMFSKSPVNSKIVNYVFSKSLKGLPENATAEMIDNAVEKELKGLIANKVLKVTGAGLIEYSTEAGQELTEIGAKELLNQAKGKKYFESPKTWGEVFQRANKAGMLGLLGGAGMQSLTQATLTAKQQLDKYQLENIENAIANKDIKELFVLNIKDRILSGEITKQQGQAELNSLKESEGVLRQIPDNLTSDDRYTSFKLINERESLRKQIEGKDPALVTPISNRINEINNELKTISENAVQKQTTGEVSVQPEARVGGEMEEGKPETEPKIVTEEGQAAIQEEVIPTEEEIDLETKLSEDLKLIKSETKPRLRVEDINIPAEEDINIETIETNLDKLPAYEVNFVTPTLSQDIQVNPIEESKSQVKEGAAEVRTIESFEGIPMVVGMSDTLAAGTVKDSTGNPMDVEGGLLYNVLGKNKNAAWAGVTEEGALTQYNEALELYNNNKNLFDKLWSEGKLPNGHVPMAIMKMADTAINSNEAVFRYLSPLVKSQPESNQQAALEALKADIETKKKVKQDVIVNSANKLYQFISSKNINSLGELFDAIVTDANNRAKGDTKNTLSLTERSLLFDLMISPQGIKDASKNTVNALFGAKKDPRSKAFLADTIYNDIAEPSMMKTPKGNMVSVVGIDVLNGGVIKVDHGNYGFGPKGQMIALISNPKHGLDVFPEWKAKATRVFKQSKKGVMPSDQKIGDEVGGAFYIDKAFRGAKVSMETSDIELLSAKLRFAFPDVTVSNSKEEFDRVLQEEGIRTKESNGKVILGMTKDGKIYLNPESDSLATPIHEFGHIWIDFLRSSASGKKGDALLSKGLSLVEGTKALEQAISKYGDNDLAREEALVELMATKGEAIIDKSKKKEFKNWLNALFKYVKEFFITSEELFKGKEFEKILKKITLDDFINIGLADLLKGTAVSPKFKAKEVGKSAAELRFSLGDNVQNFINKARAQGYSEDSIKNVLTRNGVSIETINTAMGKAEKAAKKVEITDEFAPGYDRLLKEITGIVDKSRKRGRSESDTMQNAIDYLQKSKVYENATDVQREAMIRNVRSEFKKREKIAPSAAKILGKPKAKKVAIKDEYKAMITQIKMEAKAAREAKADLNAKRKMLATAIGNMVKTGKIKASQAAVLVKRVSNLNLDNPVMVERFTNYAQRVFERADYQQRLDDAFAIRKSIRKLLKTDNQAEVSGMAKAFTKIDPSLVEDIDAYIEMADKVKNAVKPSRVKGLDVVMKEAANIAEISEYTKDEIDRQEQIKIDELLATYDFLEGEMSLKEMQDVIDALKDPTSQMDTTEKEKYVKDYLNGRFGIMSSILESMFKTGIDPMTGEEITFDEKQKELIKRALKINLNEMSVRDAIKIVESVENFITNQITSGLDAAVSSYEGAMNSKQLVDKGTKASPMKLFFSKYVGKIYSEQLFSLPMLMEKMFGGVTNSLDVMTKMGLVKLINGVNKANRQHNDIIDEYSKQEFYKSKDFMDAENVYERGMLAFLKRNLVGNTAEMKAEFERRVRMIQESINKLIEDGDPKEQQMGEMYQNIYDKLNVSKMDMDIINANASKNNLDAVNWWVNQWSKHYSDLSDISLSVYNTQLGSDLNYTPDKYKRLSSENQSLDEGAVERNGAFAITIDYTDKSKTGVLMETTRPNVMPDGRYISLDFDNNNSKALKSALVDINTASAIRQVDGFINSKSFKKLIPESEDRSIVTKRINTYIRRSKGKSIVASDTIQYLNKIVNFATALGVGKALGGINQAVSQTIPVVVNTVVNAGRFDIADAKFNEWLNESGLPISNRGLESQSTVESIDRKIDMKGTGTQEALKHIADLNQWYLKQFLVKPDVFVARSSFKSYYLQNLNRRGISTDIDWTTHEIDMDAAEYAQAMIDRQQNISDPMLAGEFLASDDPIKQIARKVVLPFASFILNQKARMYNDLNTLFSKTSSNEDKIIASRSLAGLATELATYQLIGFGIRRLYDIIAASLLGDEDDEETKKKKMLNATKYPVKSIVNDIVSPLPMTDGITTWGLNQALAQYPWMSDKEIKEAVKSRNKVLELKGKPAMTKSEEKEFIDKVKEEATYQVFEDDFDRSYGMIGIAGSTYQELAEISKLATTGEFTDEYQGRETTKKLLESDREKVKYAVPFLIAYSTGVLPKDIGTISKNYVNRIKKKAITEKQYERFESVQKDLGRKLKSWEIDMVKSKKESETAISEIEFIERNGGLTERQGREYLKLMKAIGEPKVSDIVKIKEGQTADQILK